MEQQNLISTDADFESLARDYLAARGKGAALAGEYLNRLVATIQNELGERPQMEVFTIVASRAYASVLRAVPDEITDAKKRNKATTWARSNKSTLGTWLKVAGNDVRALVAGTVTKDSLKVPKPDAERRPVSARVFEKQAARAVGQLEASVKRIDLKARKNAANVLEEAVSSMMALLAHLGVETTSRADVAMAGRKMLRTKEGALFWPVAMEGGQNGHGNG